MASTRADDGTKENLETFSLFWLDSTVNSSVENQNAQVQLRSIINHLKTFEKVDECKQYISERVSTEDRIVLIVSGRLGREVVPVIHGMRQVSAIYVYCRDKKGNEQWSKQFVKVKAVAVRLDELISSIQSDQKNRSKLEEHISFTTSTDGEQSTTGLGGQFIHSQVLIDVLLRMKPNERNRMALISLCKEEYKGNPSALNIVREFKKKYSPSEALWWYTRESFVYRMLNRAFRMQDIDVLFLFRSIIGDINSQLSKNQYQSDVQVYRGQLISKDELNRLEKCVGEFISLNSFLSTSFDRRKALEFTKNNSTASDDLESVLLEIDADPQKATRKPFADISSFSKYHGEKEVLFMAGSIFRLNQMFRSETDEQVTIIQMTLCSDDEHGLKELYDHMKSLYGSGETNLRSLGLVMWRMGKLDKAEHFFRRLLDDLSPKDPSRSALYQNLGLVTFDKGEYDASLEWHQKSLDIKLQTRSLDYVNIGISHNSIGMVHCKRGDFVRALKSFDEAVALFEKAKDEQHLTMGYVYNGIGSVYQEQQNYSQALLFYQKSLAIYQKHLPDSHPDLNSSYKSIGAVHYALGEYDLALEYYDRSLKIDSKVLPSQHPDIATTYENIGNAYESKDELQQALTYFRKAATIRDHVLPPQHPFTIRNHQAIQRILSKIEQNTTVDSHHNITT